MKKKQQSPQTKKRTGLDQVTAKFYQLLKDEMTPIPFKQFHKIGMEATLMISLYEANIIPMTKS